MKRSCLQLLFACLLPACACDQDPPTLTRERGLISIDPPALEFGTVESGATAKLAVEAINIGKGALVIDPPAISPEGAPLSASVTAPVTLEPSGRMVLEIVLDTSAPGAFTAQIVVPHDGENGPAALIEARGTISPKIEVPIDPPVKSFAVEPAQIDFGSVEQAIRTVRGFEVRNNGNTALIVTDASAATNTFTVTPARSLPAELAAGESLFVEVAYQSATPGTDADRVRVLTDAGEAAVELIAETAGANLEVQPQPIDFGTVEIDGLVMLKRALISNRGNRPLVIQSIIFESPSEELALAEPPPPLPLTLAPNDAIAVSLAYDPRDAGLDAATLTILSDDRDEPISRVPVAGAGGPASSCSIRATPSPVRFGNVARGRRLTLGIEARAAGPEACPLTAVRPGGDAAFQLAPGQGILSDTLNPGASIQIYAEYFPHEYGEHAGFVDIFAGAPIDAAFRVPLMGVSRASEIEILPAEVDLGAVPPGCGSEERRIRIYNTGEDDEDLTAAYFAPGTTPEFTLELDDFALSEEIDDEDDEYLQLFVRYRPVDAGIDLGALILEHTGSLEPVIVPLFAAGQSVVNESFQQETRSRADVLLVLDSSDSMEGERTLLAAGISALFTSATADYRVAVTTMDVSSDGERGRISGVVDSSTPNRDATLAAHILSAEDGDGDEEGLEGARLALTDPLIFADNAAFRRPEVPLAVIFASEEDDESERPFSYYRDLFDAIEGHDRRGTVVASALICDDGDEYAELAAATGGRVESICASSYEAALTRLSLESFGPRAVFPLSSRPAAAGIEVKVDGAIAGGWSYDAEANAIRFDDGAIPAPGARVDVGYAAACF